MKRYVRHVASLYQRPMLNGIDGELEDRYANPFELFFDLVFVIALSKLAILLKSENPLSFIKAILMFSVVYSIWFTLTKYTVMFLKKETNYWTRAMIFIVMLPMIFFLSIEDVTTQFGNFVFYFTLALSKISLALIFRDTISNGPLNHITVSHVYRAISKYKLIVAALLMVNALIMNSLIQLLILTIVFIIEIIIIPRRSRQINKAHKFTMPMNYNLFIERQLLFLILVFGESLVSVVHYINFHNGFISILNVVIMFMTMFLFYVRMSEEVEHNPTLIKNSNSIFYWLRVNVAVFVLYQEISDFAAQYEELGHISERSAVIIAIVLVYIVIEHLRLNRANLIGKDNKEEKLFYKTDKKKLYLMLLIPIALVFIHTNIIVINLLLLTYFTLNVIALPYREHLISNKLDEIFEHHNH